MFSLALNADVVVTGVRTFRNIAEIENPTENLVGVAAAAGQGAITAAQLEPGRSCGRMKFSRRFRD